MDSNSCSVQVAPKGMDFLTDFNHFHGNSLHVLPCAYSSQCRLSVELPGQCNQRHSALFAHFCSLCRPQNYILPIFLQIHELRHQIVQRRHHDNLQQSTQVFPHFWQKVYRSRNHQLLWGGLIKTSLCGRPNCFIHVRAHSDSDRTDYDVLRHWNCLPVSYWHHDSHSDHQLLHLEGGCHS